MPPPNEEIIRKRTTQDFIFGKVIGEGSFSTVYLAKDIQINREFAIKVLDKRHIIRERKTEYVTREKRIFQILGNSCKYFVHLYFTFQDTDRLYFVLTYAQNGELLKQINKYKGFSMECTRYYTSELVLALEYLKLKGIAHRDLKPENILFDENWHILITDFGSAKIMNIERNNDNNSSSSSVDNSKIKNVNNTVNVDGDEDDEDDEKLKRRRFSFVGTAQYVSPEILNDSASSCASDLWALGCIIYQMITGQMPFRGPSEYLIFQKITKLDYEFPEVFDKIAKDLIEKLLVINPNKRLGANDLQPYISIRKHEFFNGINWDDLGPPPKFSNNCIIDHHNDDENIINEQRFIIPDNLEPGFDEEKATRLHFDLLSPNTTTIVTKQQTTTSSPAVRKKSEPNRKITDLNQDEINQRLEQQQKTNIYHDLVEGNLILKQGIIEKKKGLFPRRRMLLLTLGPHLYYVDPTTMILKGEIPWSDDLRTEAKNFKKFFVYTPNRVYYLEDPEGYALEWCKAIDEVKSHYYPERR